MAIRIKFRVTERADLSYLPTAKRLTFAAIADAEIPVDDRIGSPSITFSVICDNPIALDLLEIGGEFYFDVVPA